METKRNNTLKRPVTWSDSDCLINTLIGLIWLLELLFERPVSAVHADFGTATWGDSEQAVPTRFVWVGAFNPHLM